MNGTAGMIEGAILHYLGDKTLLITNLCAFGSNGTSVMTGGLTGVVVRSQDYSLNMIAVHCVNHRLALAAARASAAVPYLKKSILLSE